MPKFKVTQKHLDIITNICNKTAKTKKINHKTLLAIANVYYLNYPNKVEHDMILNMNKKKTYDKLIEILCLNYEKLNKIINKDIKVDELKKEVNKTKEEKKLIADLLFKVKEVKKDVKVDVKEEVKKEKFVKPTSSSNVSSSKIEIKIKPVDNKYISELKKQINAVENNEYNIKKLELDINDDKFVKSAIDAHLKALEYKYNNYVKLSKIDWSGIVRGDDKIPGFTVNLNDIIKKMIELILVKIKELKSTTIKNKRDELMNILYNKDSGIITLKGTSRDNIKILIIKNIYMFFKVPLFFFKGFNNYMITGPAGSGKTKLAAVISNMMSNLGILATKKLIIATKQNLIAEYLGQSGPKTRNLLANALEGVLFLDEAYTLTPCANEKADNGAEEAVGELINFIDKFIGCMVLIVAGYKNKMNDCFLKFNEGMARRFPKVMDLVPYTSNDMYKIFEIFLNDSIEVTKIFTKKQREFMKSIISALNDNEVFDNQAGDMLNLSKVIGEDAILFDKKYNNDMIKFSFKKFCINKKIAIDF